MLWVQILHKTVEVLVHCYFGLTRRYILGHLVTVTAAVLLTWALADSDLFIFKESAPLVPGPTFGPWVEFWVQLPYPWKFSLCSNRSRCDTWPSNKNHPSHVTKLMNSNTYFIITYSIFCNINSYYSIIIIIVY